MKAKSQKKSQLFRFCSVCPEGQPFSSAGRMLAPGRKGTRAMGLPGQPSLGESWLCDPRGGGNCRCPVPSPGQAHLLDCCRSWGASRAERLGLALWSQPVRS